MWIQDNPNPKNNIVPDCVIRATSIALRLSWYEVYDALSELARTECSVTCDDRLWGRFFYQMGFVPFIIPKDFPRCITVKDFCTLFPHGRYVIGTGTHAVAVIDGNYHDSWDSGDTCCSFFWTIV